MNNALTDPTHLTASTSLWYGVYTPKYKLVAVEEGELVALEIAERLSKASGRSFHVEQVYVERVL